MIEEILKLVTIEEEKRLICRGSSGAIIAGIIANSIPNCKIIHIKKEGESSHDASTEYSLENILENNYKNIIVDDLIDSGFTMKVITDYMKKYIGEIDIICVTGEVIQGKIDSIELPINNLICYKYFK